MDLALETDMYSPSIDDKGNYVDKIPNFSTLKTKGLLCGCGSRKDKTYETQHSFIAHIKSKTHQKWLDGVNTNKQNFFVENKSLYETIQNQRIIIAKLEKDLSNRTATIDYLTQQLQMLSKQNNSVNDLLDFD